MVQQRNISDLSELELFAEELSQLFASRQVVLLEGGLGAGKTTLVNNICRVLGVKETTSSPTFGIHQFYQGTDRTIHHIDLYRIEDEDDLESVGFWDFFTAQEGLIFIEWADRLELSVLPEGWQYLYVRIDHVRIDCIHYDDDQQPRGSSQQESGQGKGDRRMITFNKL